MKGITIKQSITDRQDASLGLYFKEVSKLSLLSQEEEIELIHRIKNGDEIAKNKLVNANLRFVVSIAKQYQNNGLPLVDLIQEGNLGLIQSIDGYDEKYGCKFISYAVWWIRQAITKAISDQSRTVRTPYSQILKYNRINKVTSKFEQDYGRKPSYDELEEILDLTHDKIDTALLSVSKSLSLDSPFDEETTLMDIIPDSNSILCDSHIIQEDTSKIINKMISKLKDRNADVLRMIYGIDIDPMPIDEVAKRFNIGLERVRQIVKSDLKYIRRYCKNELKELK